MDQRLHIKQLEQSRQLLAAERDQAVQNVNALKDVIVQERMASQKLQQDALRWMIAFMLLTGQHELSLPLSILNQTNDWVLQRNPKPDDERIVWKIVSRADFEAAKAEAEAKAAAESEDPE